MQNEVSTRHKMYYDKEAWVMISHPVNQFYTQFLFKIDALPQDVVSPLDIATTLFKNSIPEVRQFLI